jgi:transcriptional regulator with XRE-family HTH domain
MLKDILTEKNMSVYEVSKRSGIPYTTLNDLVSGKKNIENCSVKILKTLADLFQMSLDRFYNECHVYTMNEFETFKSNVCHELKEKGQIDYLVELLSSNLIVEYWENGKRAQSLYLLGMADYLSRLCEVPLCDKYDKYRSMKLSKTVYPISATMNQKEEQYCMEHAIPEFLKFGIVEGDVFDVK